MSLLPDDDGLDLVHTRDYETKIYQLSERQLLVRGAVSDRKPPGLYVLGDPDAIEIHQMQLELEVALPGLVITQARVVFETHPHSNCPLIALDYEKLIGLSIARGFTRKIRDLFGGPNGCTHTNALLQAIAPAVVQSTWSVSVREQRRRREAGSRREDSLPVEMGEQAGALSEVEREKRIQGNLNTCHVWNEQGDHVAALRRGERGDYPVLPVRDRLRSLGRDEIDWP